MKKALASFVALLVLTSTAYAGGRYKIEVKAPASVKKGEKAVAKLHYEGTDGFHVNTEFPAKLTVTAPSGVTVEKPSQTKEDAVKLKHDGADFKITFTATDTGKKDFTGELRFAVCSDNNCNPSSEKVAFTVDVK